MAFRTKLIQRFFNVSRCSNSRTPLKSQSIIPPDRNKNTMAPDPGETSLFRRFLQRRPLYQSTIFQEPIRSAGTSSGAGAPLAGDKLIEKLRGMDIARGRLCLDGLICPVPSPPPAEITKTEVDERSSISSSSSGGVSLTMKDVKKLLRASQMEMAKAKLKGIQRDWMEYSEFVEICSEICGNNRELGMNFARMLDDSGSVIVLGNAVCLRPEQEIKTLVVNAIQGLIPLPLSSPNDPRKKELKVLEKQKSEIDRIAQTLVRRELWAGLGFFVVQTAAFMRLTFWELSWDVMEPICFYVTSIYCMAGYAFFLRTSKEPSFEGFFQSRFNSKQKRLMKIHNFDLRRYNELKKICQPFPPSDLEQSFDNNSSNNRISTIKFGDVAAAVAASSSAPQFSR